MRSTIRILTGICLLVGPLAFADEREPLSIGEVCQILTTTLGNRGNNGSESELEINRRLTRLQQSGRGFTPTPRDAGELLLVMTNDKTDITGQACAASLLLDLDNDAARAFLHAKIIGKDLLARHNAVTAIIRHTDRTSLDRWSNAELLESISDDRLLEPHAKEIRSGEPYTTSGREPTDAKTFERVCLCLGKHQAHNATEALIAAMRGLPHYRDIPRALGEMGDPKAIAPLIEALRAAKDDQQPSIILALGQLRARAAVDPLVRLLPDEDAIVSLAMIGDTRAVAPLRNLEGTSAAARLALVRIESPGSAKALLDLLSREKEADAQLPIIGAIGETRDAVAVPVLVKLTHESPSGAVRGWSIRALGAIGSNAAIDELIALFEVDFTHTTAWLPTSDVNESFRREISGALEVATGQKFGADAVAWRTWRVKTPP